MTEKNFITIIQSRLQLAFSPRFLEVVDESKAHVGHVAHQQGGRHFAIIIAADCFKDVPRLLAHRQIYALFEDMMPHQIHALKIRVIPN